MPSTDTPHNAHLKEGWNGWFVACTHCGTTTRDHDLPIDALSEWAGIPHKCEVSDDLD